MAQSSAGTSISASVGRDGLNFRWDVEVVQRLLNGNSEVLVPLRRLIVDGHMGPRTEEAILEFQRRAVNLSRPDGRVDPNGRTFRALITGARRDGPTMKSGRAWVDWANRYAKKSTRVDDLAEPFRSNARAFIKAVEEAGAKVSIRTTKRSAKRAYLFHWSWKIALGKCKPSDATPRPGVPIAWDHGDLAASRQGAKEMVQKFRLAIPPNSDLPPSLSSNHIRGTAIDMYITWSGALNVKKKNGKVVRVKYGHPNRNRALHEVARSYGIIKNTRDAPHWSYNGR